MVEGGDGPLDRLEVYGRSGLKTLAQERYCMFGGRDQSADRSVSFRRVAAASAGIEPALAFDTLKIEPAAVPHCPQCGGCRFITFELPKEVSASCADTS